jgi:hypothetical protein
MLKAQGTSVGEKRVTRLIRENEIRAKQSRKCRVTNTDSSLRFPRAEHRKLY